MKYAESAVSFPCEGERLLGIIAQPETPAVTGVIIIVGGPQYRAGSHRQFVLLSRALAAAGHAVLRFDYRGMGDSTGAQRPFSDVSADVSAAVDGLQKWVPSVLSVVLWGLCDGASAALIYCHQTQDSRVAGLCLLNPWVRSESSLARTQVKHYYAQRLMQREFWAKLASGKVAASAVAGLLKNIRSMHQSAGHPASADLPFQQQMALAWGTFQGSIFLVLSSEDYTAKEFLEFVRADAAWSKALAHRGLSRKDVAGADHTFSDLEHRVGVEKLTANWLENLNRGQQ